MNAPAAIPRARWRTAVPFVLITLIWGTTWIVIKSQLGVVPVSWSVAYRFLLAAVVMFGLCAALRRPLALPRAGHAVAAISGFMQFCVNFQFVYRAEEFVTSGLVAVAFALLMVANALLGWLWLKQPVGWRFAGGAALGILGVLLLFAHELTGPAESTDVAAGLALTGAAVLAASVGNVMQVTPRVRALPPFAFLAWSLLYGAVINVAVAAATAGPPVFDPRPEYWAGVAMLGVLASALAFALYYELIRQIGPARAAYTSVMIPLVAMALSTVFEGYRWGFAAVAGAALAIAGLVVALRARG